jgi:hypothetical protein
MTHLRTSVLFLALAGCEAFSRPAAPEPADPNLAARPAPRPVVRSCPASGTPTPIEFEPRISLGEHDGITWLYGESAGEPVLAHLGADDRVVLTPVPLANAQTGEIAGGRIWLYASDPATSWLSVDITDPEKPVAGAVVPLKTGAPIDRAMVFAVGASRAVAVVGGMPDLVLLDSTTGLHVAPPHPLDLTFRAVDAVCSDERCFVLGVENIGEGEPSNGIFVVRVAPDGTRERELLTDEWSGDPRLARHGDQVLVAWSTGTGVRLRALDREGKVLAPSVPVPWDSKRAIRGIRLFAGDGAVALAVGEQHRWSVALVGPHGNPGPLRELVGATRPFLFAAPLGDGLAWLNVGEDPAADGPDADGVTRSLPTDATAGFLPNTGEPAAPIALPGGGDGELVVYILTRPGAAGAVLVRRAGEDGPVYRRFALVRATCKPPPPAGLDGKLPGQPAGDALAPDDGRCRDEPQ